MASENACRPECLPSTIFDPSKPISVGSMISYVSRLESTPCWWMPDSWAKALAPTTALFGWTGYPVSIDTRREVRAISFRVRRWVIPSDWPRVATIMAISSSEQLPARSPMPFTATSTCRAPFCTPAIELATARPRSLWQWVEMTTSSRTASRTVRTSSPNSCGNAYPTVSGTLIVVAPSSTAARITSSRNSSPVRVASCAENSTSSV